MIKIISIVTSIMNAVCGFLCHVSIGCGLNNCIWSKSYDCY